MLAAPFAGLTADAGWLVDQNDRRFGFVAVLAPGSATAGSFGGALGHQRFVVERCGVGVVVFFG